jgi:hypothetical protein
MVGGKSTMIVSIPALPPGLSGMKTREYQEVVN